MKQISLSDVKDDLSKYLRLAEQEEIIITRHGKPAGVLIGFETEEDWFEYRLEHDPRFLERIERARRSIREGAGPAAGGCRGLAQLRMVLRQPFGQEVKAAPPALGADAAASAWPVCDQAGIRCQALCKCLAPYGRKSSRRAGQGEGEAATHAAVAGFDPDAAVVALDG